MPNNRIKVFGNKLYHGGSSSIPTPNQTVTINFAGVWDGTVDGWTTLDGGITSGYGRGIYIVDENHIYIFGVFSQVGIQNPLIGSAGNFNIARWNGSQWNAVGAMGNTNNEVKDVFYDSERNILYAVGNFTTIMGVPANRVAKFEGGTWQPLRGGANSIVQSCCIDSQGRLYVCGSFGGMTNSSFLYGTTGIARWNIISQEWESLASSSYATVWDVIYEPNGDHVYMSGSYSYNIGGVANTRKLARFHVASGTWESIGVFNSPDDSTIYDIVWTKTGKLAIAGYFVSNGSDVSIWDGTTWSGQGKEDGFGLIPDQSRFGPIDLEVDGNETFYINRNAGGFYIKMTGWSHWKRLDQIDQDITISSTSLPTESAGPTGPTGSTGSGPSGPSGPGPSGPSGSTGPTGPSGGSGPTGPSGSTGPTGPSGGTGPTGPSGGSGSTGSIGSGGGELILSYADEEFVFNMHNSINIIPIISGIGDGNYRFEISPALPMNLIMNEYTGVISGVAMENLEPTTFTITAVNIASQSFERRPLEMGNIRVKPRNMLSCQITISINIDRVACVGEDTMILTADRGYIQISKLKKGDSVVTDDYRVVQIQGVCRFNYQGDIYKINRGSFGISKPFADMVISPSHKYRRGGKWYKPKKHLKKWVNPNWSVSDKKKGCPMIRLYHLILDKPSDCVVANGLVIESYAGGRDEGGKGRK